MASTNPKCGETQETKQVYERRRHQSAAVRQRLQRRQHHQPRLHGHRAHHRLQSRPRRRLPPARDGPRLGALHGCERCPAAGKQARRFLNWDLDTARRRAVQHLLQACNSNSSAAHRLHRLGVATSAPAPAPPPPSLRHPGHVRTAAATPTSIRTRPAPTPTMPPRPIPTVLTSCENYGLTTARTAKT